MNLGPENQKPIELYTQCLYDTVILSFLIHYSVDHIQHWNLRLKSFKCKLNECEILNSNLERKQIQRQSQKHSSILSTYLFVINDIAIQFTKRSNVIVLCQLIKRYFCQKTPY